MDVPHSNLANTTPFLGVDMHSRNARFGFKLFLVYLAIYGGFVLLNAFAPQVMESTPIPGITLAIIYGFALIIIAFVLAMIYGVMCVNENSETPAIEESAQENNENQGGEK